MTNHINDGTYFLHPDGCCWIAVRFRGGREVGRTEESMAGTHAAANDMWAGVVPVDADAEVDVDQAAVIVREVMGDDVCVDMVIVTMAANGRYWRDELSRAVAADVAADVAAELAADDEAGITDADRRSTALDDLLDTIQHDASGQGHCWRTVVDHNQTS